MNGITVASAAELKHYVDSANSYLGFLAHTASFNKKKALFDELTDFWKCCYLKGVGIRAVKIRKKYKLSTILINNQHENHK